MRILRNISVCDNSCMKPARHAARLVALTLVAGGLTALAQTNEPAATNSAATHSTTNPHAHSYGTDEASFAIISERNIFNANRSGGRVQIGSSRRPTRVDYFTLVGTMDYAKGVFAFFDGSSSDYSKVLKANGIIAGYKLIAIQPSTVKLEADGKQVDLPVGSQMRREDEGTWRVAEAPARSYSSSGSSENSSSSNRESYNGYNRSSRNDNDRNEYSRSEYSRRREDDRNDRDRSERSDNSNRSESSSTITRTNSGASEAEILKRLQEQREKD